MRILVDADSCPVKGIIVEVARKLGIPVIMFIDTCHILDDGYSKVVIVDKGRDSVDIALINATLKNDIIVTGDYGVAAMALSKMAVPIDNHGHVISQENIDRHLFERHISQKIRRSGGRAFNPKARKKEDNLKFERKLMEICSNLA